MILLFFANHQPVSVLFDTSYTTNLADGSFPAVFLVGMFMALFVVYGFDTAGTFGEETIDASRQAPRGVLSAIWLSGIVGAIFLLAVTLSFQDMAAAVATGQAFGFPIADTIKQNLTFAIGGLTLGDLYLVVILIAVYVCTLAIQGATVRLMFSMGRDRRLPLGGTWGHVNPTLKTPANAVDRGRHPCRDPVLRDRRRRGDLHRHRGDRDDLHRLLPVQPRRPHRAPQGLAARRAPGSRWAAGARSSTSSR